MYLLYCTLFQKKMDKEYMEFLNIPLENIKNKIQYKNFTLFDTPNHYSIGHCVFQDLKMSKGIAVQFK